MDVEKLKGVPRCMFQVLTRSLRGICEEDVNTSDG
jgi:hypothetical protein